MKRAWAYLLFEIFLVSKKATTSCTSSELIGSWEPRRLSCLRQEHFRAEDGWDEDEGNSRSKSQLQVRNLEKLNPYRIGT
jgi:hypothetical protein